MKGIEIDFKDISDSREMMESEESPKLRWFIYILLGAIVTAVICASFFRIDEFSKVNGEIKTQEAASYVFSLNNCKLKQILVVEGQKVKKGDTLFLLDADYAKNQKTILEQQLDTYNNDLKNTELLKKSIEENKNLFMNTSEDSKYYYRFEQYQNGNLLTAQEINNSVLTDDLSKEDKEHSLAVANTAINDKSNQLAEYRQLLECVQNRTVYSAGNGDAAALYNEFETNYKKAELLCEQNRIAYDTAQNAFLNQPSDEIVTSTQVEKAKQESESLLSSMNEKKSYYLNDIRTKIVILENQCTSDTNNADITGKLDEYIALKKAVESGDGYNSSDSQIKSSYDSFNEEYSDLSGEYSRKYAEYQRLYSAFLTQSSSPSITESDVSKTKNAYDTSIIDKESIQSTYVSQIQNKISALEDEIKTMENNTKSLEVSLKNIKDHEAYEKLSTDKLKNEAIITVDSEIDTLKQSIVSLQSQFVEVDETIKNAEIKATVDGTVTLISELSAGDIVQAGNSLCSIVPENGELKVTLYIPENEITKVNVGQRTEYIIDAIPFAEYGKLTGEIVSISADSIMSETSDTKYYIAQASISGSSLTNKEGVTRDLKTGMLLEAKAISGSKRVIIWLFEKINFID